MEEIQMVNIMKDKITTNLKGIKEGVNIIEHKVFISQLDSIERRVDKSKTIGEIETVFNDYAMLVEEILFYIKSYLKNIGEI